MTKTAASKTAVVNHAYRTLLGNIVCDRYFDRDEALAAIDVALEAREISVAQARDLESRVG